MHMITGKITQNLKAPNKNVVLASKQLTESL